MVTLLILSGIYFIQVSVQAGNWQVYSMYSNHIDQWYYWYNSHVSYIHAAAFWSKGACIPERREVVFPKKAL